MLNESRGNMYEWVTHTWNSIKGKCSHNCSYCFMKKMLHGRIQPDLRIDEPEFKTDLGTNNIIFVGSSTDDWAKDVPSDWIMRMLDHCAKFSESHYLFQSKNPARFLEFANHPVMKNAVFCTTIETNRDDFTISQAPPMIERARAMAEMKARGFQTYVTAEPLMDFDLDEMVNLLLMCQPNQVNLGKNSNYLVQLPEPTPDKFKKLIEALSPYTTVKVKKNANVWLK